MAGPFYVDDGGDDGDGLSWATAKTTIAAAVALLAAGEDIYVGDDSVEQTPGSLTLTFPGTATAPNRVISVDQGTTNYLKATVQQIQVNPGSSTQDLIINGYVQFYGISIEIPDDVTTNSIQSVLFDDCELELRGSNSRWTMGHDDGRSIMVFKNTNVFFSSGSGGWSFNPRDLNFFWEGGALTHTTAPTALFVSLQGNPHVKFSGVDLSGLSTALVDVASSGLMTLELHHCLLHASVSLGLGTNDKPGMSILMSGCDDTSGNSLQRTEYLDFWGSTVEDLATFRTAGAKDGAVNYSHKIVSTGNALEFSEPTKGLCLAGKIRSTGSKTFKIQCVWDSATDIKNNEIWFELEFLGTAAETKSDLDLSTRMANILATPADHTTNSESWTVSPSMTNENTFELSATVTVNRVGPFIAHVYLAKPNTTVFYGPLVDVT